MSSDDGTSNKRKRCDYLRELQPRNESDPKELWESISHLLLSHSLVTKWTSWDDSIRPICVPPPTDFQIPSAKRPFPDERTRTAKWECWPIYTANLATTKTSVDGNFPSVIRSVRGSHLTIGFLPLLPPFLSFCIRVSYYSIKTDSHLREVVQPQTSGY